MVPGDDVKTDGSSAGQERVCSDRNEAFAQVYGELRRIAGNHFRNQPVGGTLQPTALVHEAFLRLSDETKGLMRDRNHFLAVAATAMRQILVDHARSKLAGKRGGAGRAARKIDDASGGRRRVPLTDSMEKPGGSLNLDELLGLDEALGRLSKLDEKGRKVQIVELRFFAGMSVDEVAGALDVSVETVKKDWQFARKWLKSAIDRGCAERP